MMPADPKMERATASAAMGSTDDAGSNSSGGSRARATLSRVEGRLPEFRLPHLSLPRVDMRLSQLGLRIPNLDLCFAPLRTLADLPRVLQEPPPRPGGLAPRWSRYLTSALTLLALLAAFRSVDRTITRWSTSSEPAFAWAQEAAEWYENYPTAATLAEDLLSEPVPSRKEVSAVRLPEQVFVRVSATAYSSQMGETDADPSLTASNTVTRPGTAAVSRDLLRAFTPGAPFDYGDKILIPGVGIYRVEDTMNGRWRRKIDLWFDSTADARRWGRQVAYVTKVQEDAPTMTYQVR